MTKRIYKAALFDLDGVLIDTEGLYTQFWNEIGKQFDKPSTFANDIKGTTLNNILDRYFQPEYHRDIENAINEYQAAMPFVLFDGVMEFLSQLKQQNVPMAIVTSSDDAKMKSLALQLPQLLDLMNCIVDASMVTLSKPDPQGYLMAASMLEVDPKECIVFEDSLQGLEAGRRAGAKVVGLITTNPAHAVLPLCDQAIESWIGITPQQYGFHYDGK